MTARSTNSLLLQIIFVDVIEMEIGMMRLLGHRLSPEAFVNVVEVIAKVVGNFVHYAVVDYSTDLKIYSHENMISLAS